MQLENVKLSPDGGSVVILDQTLLPNEERYLTLSTPEECWEAIHSLRVRGAPAIGIFAGYAVYVLARQDAQLEGAAFRVCTVLEMTARIYYQALSIGTPHVLSDELVDEMWDFANNRYGK